MTEQNVGEVSESTRAAEADEARSSHDADRPPTPEEESLAEEETVEEGVGEHFRDMAERGANEPGEGRIV